jgi:thiol:disulfide interchange protein
MRRSEGSYPFTRVLPLGVLMFAIVVAPRLLGSPDAPGRSITPSGSPGSNLSAILFSRARIDARRTMGRPVFVNFTAAWCITCMVNETIVLSSERIGAAFAESLMSKATGPGKTPILRNSCERLDNRACRSICCIRRI